MKNITAQIVSARKGSFQSIAWKSPKTPSAKFKGVQLETVTKAVVRAGIDFANLSSEREREEIGSLPWGEWETFPFTIQHKGERYIRLYPSGNLETRFFADGKEVTKEEFQAYQRPSDISSGSFKKCFNVKESNLLEEA